MQRRSPEGPSARKARAEARQPGARPAAGVLRGYGIPLFLLALALTCCRAADPGPAQPDAGPASTGDAATEAKPYGGIYLDAAKWSCRPGMEGNPCAAEVTITDVLQDGSTELVTLPPPAANAHASCFYVYPTLDPGLLEPPRNRDFPEIERLAVLDAMSSQALPFRELCDVYAPIYRQASLGTLLSDAKTREAGLEHGYRDVADAFEYVLADTEPDRPLVLLAHSQGAMLTLRLLQRRFEKDPALLDRLVVAVLAGPLGSFAVPKGKRVGRSLNEIPLCGSETETGCTLTWNSFHADAPPSAAYGEIGGVVVAADDDTGCNPGLYDEAPTRLGGALFLARPRQSDLGIALQGIGGSVDSDYARYPDLFVGRCAAAENGLRFLEIALDPKTEDPRTAPVTFDNPALSDPTIGLHALDYSFVMHEVVEAVRTKVEAFSTEAR